MKKKFAFNKYFKGRELLIIAQRGEYLDTRRAKWLNEVNEINLLRFGYEETRSGTLLHYDVGGLVSLKKFLKHSVLDDAVFMKLMLSVQGVLDTCSSRHIPTELILFDSSSVFVDDQSQPRFVVTPLDNVPFTVDNSPLTMLRALGNPRRLSFVSPSTEMLSAKLEAFVLNQNSVFSANAFRTFLRNQCGVDSAKVAHDRKGDSWRDPYTNGGTTKGADDTKKHLWNGVDEQNGRGRTRGRGVSRIRCVMERLSTGEIYPITANQRMYVGRGSHNEVQVTGNPKISRNHAILVCGGDFVSLVDLESPNGTWVQGRRLAPNKQINIPMGQRFSLADEDFVVKRD